MKKKLLISPLILVACSDLLPNENTTMAQGKQPIDRNVVVELADLSSADLYDNTVLLRKKNTFNPDLVRHKNLQQTGAIPNLNVETISVPNGVDIIDFIEDLRASDQYEFVEPNLIRQLDTHIISANEAIYSPGQSSAASINDPYAYLQWHMETMQVSQMGTDAQGDSVTVAVLDTGVNLQGTDTPINMVEGYDYIDNDSDPSDFHGHGTHVAGTIAQATNNSLGVRGVAPNASIIPVKVLSDDGFGGSLSIANGITYAVDRGADIINMSLVSSQSTSVESSAVSYALNNGVVIVAATGNEGHNNTIYFPAAYEGVIAVGSVGLDNIVTAYSNKGPEMDFTAPGGDFFDDLNGDGYSDGVLQETINAGAFNFYFYEGTSMASPHAAGAYAALMSAGFEAEEITEAFQNSSMDMGSSGWDKDYGYGVIQLKDAYDYLQSMTVSQPLELLAFEARYHSRDNRIEVHHFNPEAVSSILCAVQLNGQEHCVELLSNPNHAEQYNSISNVDLTNGFSFTLMDSAGSSTEFGPFSISSTDYNWTDEISCSAQVQLFNLQASSNSERLQINFTTSENLRVDLCGERNHGTIACQSDWYDGNGELSLWNASSDVNITLRNEQGCTRGIGGLPDFIGALPER